MLSHTGSINPSHFTLLLCSPWEHWACVSHLSSHHAAASAAQGSTSVQRLALTPARVLAKCLHGVRGGFVLSLSVWPLTKVQGPLLQKLNLPGPAAFPRPPAPCAPVSPRSTQAGHERWLHHRSQRKGTHTVLEEPWSEQISIAIAAGREGQAWDRSCGGFVLCKVGLCKGGWLGTEDGTGPKERNLSGDTQRRHADST